MHFFCKLIGPRPTFPADMTPDEAALMQAHVAYWREWMAQGRVEAFGMVADPAGAYGIGIVDFDDEAAARAFADGDPTIRAAAGFRLEIQPMPRGAVLRGRD